MWLVQGLFGLGAAFMAIVLVTQQDQFAKNASRAVIIAANVMVLFMISAQVGLLLGTQLRQQWARWLTVALLILMSASSIISSAGSTGSRLASSFVSAGLCVLLVARLAFGAPARRYFGREVMPYQ